MTANYLFFSCFSLTKKHPLLQAIHPTQKKRRNYGKKFRPFFLQNRPCYERQTPCFFKPHILFPRLATTVLPYYLD